MRCPDEMCDNNGNSVDHHPDCDAATRTYADECPVTTRCEWCYGNQESDFNQRVNSEVAAAGLAFVSELIRGGQYG